MHTRIRPLCFLVALILFGCTQVAKSGLAQEVDLKHLDKIVEKIRAQHKLPAMGAAIVTSKGLESIGTSGVRKRGDATKATDDDLWHIGSDGKAITATMIAKLVEREVMKWDQTLGETFAEVLPDMPAGMKEITVLQLLSHQSGLDANFKLSNYVGRKDLTAARIDVIKEAIKTGLKHKAGSKYLYSNWGYTVASAMAEKSTGKTYENLMREEIFEPLAMKSAGFGGTGNIGKIDQPWPHTQDGKPTKTNGPDMDNLPVMAAAGTMHMTLTDWGKFVSEHLLGEQGKSKLLKRESFAKLHKPNRDQYAMGWIIAPRPWAGGSALNHAGDNTMNHAVVWAAPAKDFAVLIVTNQSSASKAADDLASAIILEWVKRK